jgi:TolB-like protein
MQVFVALARADGGVVSRDELVEACWKGLHVADDSISRCIIRLRRLGEDSGAFSIGTVARVGYRLTAISSADEPVAEAADPIQAAAARRRTPARPMLVAGCAAVAMAAATGVWAWFASHPAPRPSARVAILPFQVISGGTEAKAFSASLVDRIIDVANVGDLQMIAPTGDDAKAAAAAGSAQGVRFMLDGSVEQSGRSTTVTTHLQDVRDHVILWTGQVQSEGDPAVLKDLAAGSIVAIARCAAVADSEGSGRLDSETLGPVVKACELLTTAGLDPVKTDQLLDALRQVVRRAPGFSKGHSELGMMLLWVAQLAPAARAADLRLEARREAEAALKADGHNGDAYVVLADISPPRDFAAKEKLLQRGLAVEPMSPDLNANYGGFLAGVGRLQEGAVANDHALALNPLNITRVGNGSIGQAMVGNFTEADEIAARLERLWPGAVETWGVRFYDLLWQRDYVGLQTHMDDPRGRPFGTEFRDMWWKTAQALATNDPQKRQEALRVWRSQPIDNETARSLHIEIYTAFGDLDDAFAVADELQLTPSLDGAALFTPLTAPLRRDPRFMRIAAKLGLADYWRTSGHWPDFCSQPGLPYDCKAEAAKWAGPHAP